MSLLNIILGFFNKLTTKTVLEGVKCYLSGPIEFDNESVNWRTEPKNVLVNTFKINVFDPYADPKQQWTKDLKHARNEKNYELMANIASSFVRKDLGNVDNSGMLIAYLPKGVPTTGTHHEIINAINLKKPVILMCPAGKEHIPIWYFGFVPHEQMFGSWEEVYDYLREVNAGKHKDNDRWNLIYGLI